MARQEAESRHLKRAKPPFGWFAAGLGATHGEGDQKTARAAETPVDAGAGGSWSLFQRTAQLR